MIQELNVHKLEGDGTYVRLSKDTIAINLGNDVAAPQACVEHERRRRKHIDEKMAKTLLENPASIDWTMEDWATKLRCSKSTVHDTTTWGTIMNLRKLREAEKATTQQRYKSSDKRRLGGNRRKRLIPNE